MLKRHKYFHFTAFLNQFYLWCQKVVRGLYSIYKSDWMFYLNVFLYLETFFYANSRNMLCFYKNAMVTGKSKSLHFISNVLIKAVRLQCRTSHKQKNKRIYHNKLKSFCVLCNYNNAFKYFKYYISSSSIIFSSVTGLFLNWVQSQQL